MWGISRATIYRHIKKGNLSVSKDGKSTWVDTSEMVRVFGEKKQADTGGVSSDTSPDTHDDTGGDSGVDTRLLEQEVAHLKEQNEALQSHLDQVRENEQKLLGIIERQTALLTDQRGQASQPIWSRLFKRSPSSE